ncbi:MAG: LysM peptidoglycan-binding domain-containing protein [Chitinispirillaceae bacterium]|nr:LysM peptidoglycan-binding domain-containing protein [Chitinispirillaceae bacterium]
MPIPLNEWYTIKSGDTLSKIAAEAGLPKWQIIYNDPQNEPFRKKRPDPDLIYPGDTIWIPDPSKATTSTGKKTVFVVPAEKIQVTEIFFESEVKIHYVRLSASHSDYLAPNVPTKPGYLHLNPPTVYPEAGKPHWMFDSSTSKPSESWPTVLIRDGAPSAGSVKRNLQVSFSSATAFDGDRIIKAESTSGELVIGEKTITFKKGKAAKASLTFTKVPSTVKKLSGITLKWFAKNGASGSFTEFCRTQHTLFIVDDKPLKGNLRASQDMFLFEVIDWSCSWASGRTGLKSVLAAIWKEFNPAKANHSTGLVYWKDHDISFVNQDIDFAIRSQDDPDPRTQNNASCVVFDRIFINAVCLHGIQASEIEIRPSKQAKNGFTVSGKQYKCVGFNASSTKAQGTNNAPASWGNHWIADVYDDSSSWKIYDASYGAAAYDSNVPVSHKYVDVLNYEKAAVKNFDCYAIKAKKWVDLSAGAKPSEQPHLEGWVWWTP